MKKTGRKWLSVYLKAISNLIKNLQENTLKIPQLGIYRETLHQIMDAIDAHHQFATDTSDFIIKFSKPLKKSLKTLDQSLKSKHAEKNGFKSTKDIYDFISGVFDKECDDYLKSPEGVQDVANVIQSYVTYRERSDEAKDIWLKSLSIPTKKEMEDVYRSIYDLKKRVRNQDKQITEQQKLINSLSERIMSLEAGVDRNSIKKKTLATVKMKKPPAKNRTAKVKKVAKKRPTK